MKGLSSRLIAIGLVAIIGHFTIARVEAQGKQPTHQELENLLNTLRTTVESIRSQLEAQPDRLPPPWSEALPAAERFVPVLGGAAVLDRETGLVWEQSPAASTFFWADAQSHCNNKVVGGRKGWRMPTLQELMSLLDPSNPGSSSDPDLPVDHPFSNVQGPFPYWSATALASNPSVSVWNMNFGNGNAGIGPKVGMAHYAWCVRGNGGPDEQ